MIVVLECQSIISDSFIIPDANDPVIEIETEYGRVRYMREHVGIIDIESPSDFEPGKYLYVDGEIILDPNWVNKHPDPNGDDLSFFDLANKITDIEQILTTLTGEEG
jgi:hypothetical protein